MRPLILFNQSLCSYLAILRINQQLSPLFTVPMFFLSLIHFSFSLQPEHKLLFQILKWTDISSYSNHKTLLYAFFALATFQICSLFLMGIRIGKKKIFALTNFENYGLKVLQLIGLFISHMLCLPIIRTCQSCMQMEEPYLKILSGILLSFFIIIYLFFMFIQNDLSPYSKNVNAEVLLPNSLTVFNIYRSIVYFLVSNQMRKQLLIINSIFILFLIFSFMVRPILTWRYNKFYQIYIALVIWVSLINLIEGIPGQVVGEVYYFGGMPIFSIFCQFILRKRLLIILKQEKSAIKLKLVYFLIMNKDSYRGQLDIFLLDHYAGCKNLQCACQQLFCMQKSNQEKNMNDQRRRYILFNLLFLLQHQFCLGDNVDNSSEYLIDKKQNFQQVMLDKAQILHYEQKKSYESMQELWKINKYCSIGDNSISNLKVRWLVERQALFETFLLISNQKSCKYALDFYQLQTRVLSYRTSLLKVISQTIQFWKELICHKPNKQLLLLILNKILKQKRLLIKKRKYYISENLIYKKTCQYDSQEIITKAIERIHCSYTDLFRKTDQKIKKHNHNIQQTNIIVTEGKNLFSQKVTGLAVVSIDEGQNFGNIVVTNKKFWEIFKQARFENPKVNDFLPYEFLDIHTKTMKQFLAGNTHYYEKYGGYVLCKNNQLNKVRFSIQILCDIERGLFASVFFTQSFANIEAPAFLMDSKGKILYFNECFRNQIGNNNQKPEQVILPENLEHLYENKQTEIVVLDKIYKVKFISSFNLSNPIYCELNMVEEINTQTDKMLNIQTRMVRKVLVNNNQRNRSSSENISKFPIKIEAFKDQELITQVGSQIRQLKKWKFIVFFIFFANFAISISISSLSKYRSGIFRTATQSIKQVSDMIVGVTQTATLVREANVLSYNNYQTVDQAFYLSQFERLQKLLNGFSQASKWSQTFTSFQMNTGGHIIESEIPFSGIYHRHLVSSLSSYRQSGSQWNFDYLDEERKQKAVGYYQLFRIITNSYYIIIPNLFANYRVQNEQKWNQRIRIPIPIAPLICTLVALSLLILTYTIALNIKFQKGHHEIFKLFECFTGKEVKERISCLKKFRNTMSDIQFVLNNFEKSSNFAGQEEKEKTENKLGLQDKQNRKVNNPLRQRTQESLEKSEWVNFIDPIKKQNENQQRDQEGKQSFKAGKLIKQYKLLRTVLVFIVTLSTPTALLSVQLTTISKLSSGLTLIDLEYQQAQLLHMSYATVNEFNYEMSQFSEKDFSLLHLISDIINRQYQLLKLIDSIQIQDFDSYIEIKRFLKEKDFCSVMAIYFQYFQCLNEKKEQFKKLQRLMIVENIEEVRNLYRERSKSQKYKNSQQKIAFSKNKSLLWVKEVSKILAAAQKKVIEILLSELQQKIIFYQIGMFSCSLICMFVLLMAIFFWFPLNKSQMREWAERTKIMIELIGSQFFYNEEKLKQQLRKKRNYIEFLQ